MTARVLYTSVREGQGLGPRCKASTCRKLAHVLLVAASWLRLVRGGRCSRRPSSTRRTMRTSSSPGAHVHARACFVLRPPGSAGLCRVASRYPSMSSTATEVADVPLSVSLHCQGPACRMQKPGPTKAGKTFAFEDCPLSREMQRSFQGG